MSTISARRRPVGLQIAANVFVIGWLILAAFPFLWTLWGSFKIELDFFLLRIGLTH